MRKNLTTKAALGLVAIERSRQDQLVLDGKLKFNCSNPLVPREKKLPVLMEEVGEVARAMLEMDTPSNAESTDHLWVILQQRREHLREELIQVAAVAVAWAESIDLSPAKPSASEASPKL